MNPKIRREFSLNPSRFLYLTALLAFFGVVILSGCASMGFGAKAPQVHHIVLLKLRDSTSAELTAKIVAGSNELPAKVPGIVAFDSGVNESPEGLHKGFKHALLMTFDNQAALDVYGPHPGHQAFVEFAKPHFEKTFVCDFPLDEAVTSAEPGQVHHLVFISYRDNVTEATIAEIGRRFAALPGKIPGIVRFRAGVDTSGRAKDLKHAFIVTFANAQARDDYIPHPAHEEFVKFLRSNLKDVLVVDFTVGG